MSEIAIQAGVGRATLHRHFRTREDLVSAIGIRCIEETNAAVRSEQTVGEGAVDRLRSTFRAVIPLGDRYSFLGTVFAYDSKLLQSYESQLDWVESLVEDLKKQGEIAKDVPSPWVVAQIDQLVWSAWNAIANGYLSSDDATELAMRTFLEGLR